MAPVVLVADDDPDDVLLLSRAFLTAGLPHRVFHVRNEREALRYLAGEENYIDRFRFPLPRLLILDLNTSRKDGLDLLRWIQQSSELANLPVVVISASENPMDRQIASNVGVEDYRIKPAGLPGWVTIVKDVAARWLSNNPKVRRSITNVVAHPAPSIPEVVVKL